MRDRDEILVAGDRLLRSDGAGHRALALLGPPTAGVRSALDRIVARWQDPSPPVVVVGRPSDLLEPQRVLDAMASGLPGRPGSALLERVLRALAAHPLLLVLIDAHWVEPTVLDVLTQLLDAGGDRPLALLVGGTPTRALESWVEGLTDLGRAELVTLEPLPEPEAVEVLGTPAELEVLLGIAVLGEPARRSLLDQVVDLPPAVTDSTVDRLVGSGVLQEVSAGHVGLADTDASTIVRAAAPGAVTRAHRRAFRALLDTGERVRAARHGLEGDLVGDRNAVAVTAAEAGHALARGAVEEAVQWSTGALRLAGAGVTPAELGLHGDTLVAAGRPSLATDPYRRAIDLATAEAPGEGADLRRRLARALAYAGDVTASTAASLAAWTHAGDDPSLRADIAIEHLHALLQEAGPAGALRQLDAYEATGEMPPLPRVDTARRFLRFWAGATTDDADRLVAAAATTDDPTRTSPFDPTLCGTFAARMAEQWELDEPVLRDEIVRSELAGRTHAVTTFRISLADSLIRQGRPSEALELLDAIDRPLFPLMAEAVDLTAACALVEQGRADELADRLDRLPARPRMWGSDLWVRHQRAALDLLRDDAEAASERYLALAEAAHDLGVGLPEGIPWAEHAIDAHATIGRLDAVEQLIGWLEAGRLGSARWRAVVAGRGRAALAQAAGDLAGAEAHLEAAVGLDGGRPLVRARVLSRLADLRRTTGRRAGAATLYREALAVFSAAGAPTDAARCLAGLRAVGGRRAGPIASPAGLTPQEHRVATLAAAGRLAREIAEELFISRRTVETHLRHVYEKLGVRAKADLVGLDLGPEPGADR